MIFLVYHFDMSKYSFDSRELWTEYNEEEGSRKDSDGPNFPEDYDVVAAIEADSIDEVFEKTNSIENHWSGNPGVIPIKKECRSTSLGDIVVNKAGKKFLCAYIGWKEI